MALISAISSGIPTKSALYARVVITNKAAIISFMFLFFKILNLFYKFQEYKINEANLEFLYIY